MSTLRAYFELLRLPAVFTAVADVMMGYLVTQGDLRPLPIFLLLVATSCSLYLAGMALNDVFDAEVDARRRPERPIPSGRVMLAGAQRLGWGLLVAGVAVAVFASWWVDNVRPATVAALLVLCVVLYDCRLKRTVFGPIAMGGCRLLNVLLGMSLAVTSRWPFEPSWTGSQLAVAIGIGTYISGVTWFARGESRAAGRARPLFGVAATLTGLLILSVSPGMSLIIEYEDVWPLLWIGLALLTLIPCVWAIFWPSAQLTQVAVRNLLRGIIVIDAAIVLGFCGVYWAGAVLALVVPMLLLERWFNTT